MSSSEPRLWMWSDACELLERAQRMRSRFFEPVISPGEQSSWAPPLDIYETDDEIWVLSALPGVVASDIRISLVNDVLILTAQRALPRLARHAVMRRMEIPHGQFERRIQLSTPGLTVDTWEFTDGCVCIRLDKSMTQHGACS